jgi:hypothetical protein
VLHGIAVANVDGLWMLGGIGAAQVAYSRKVRTRAQGSMPGCPSGSCRGFNCVLGQWGIHLAHPLIDLEGERVPPPTERQGYDTIILS